MREVSNKRCLLTIFSMGVVALFHLQNMFSFRYFLKKIGVLDSYFVHRYIIIKYTVIYVSIGTGKK